MLFHSVFGKILQKIYIIISNAVKSSHVYNGFCSLESRFKKAMLNSAIVKFFIRAPYSDRYNNSWILRMKAKIIEIISKIAMNMYKHIENYAQGSLLFRFISFLLTHLDLLVCATVFLIAFLPTMLITVVVLFTIILFLIKIIGEKQTEFIKIPLFLWLMSIILVVIYAALSSFTLMSSVKAAVLYIIFIIFTFVIANTINTRQKLVNVVNSLIFSAVLVAIYGIFQKNIGMATATSWIDAEMFGSIGTRVFSTFENPNVLGEYLILIIPIAFSMLWSKKPIVYKILIAMATGIMGLCLIYTQSRGSWIGLLIGLMVFALIADRRLIIPGVIAIILIPFLAPGVMDRFMSIGNLADSSSNYRLSIIIGSIGIIKDYWVSGIGLGLEPFALIYPQHSLAAAYALHSHNFYLQLIIETGIVGFFVMFMLMINFYKNIFAKCINENTTKTIRYLLLGIVAGTIAYLTQGIVENIWFNYRILLCFWTIIGIGLGGVKID